MMTNSSRADPGTGTTYRFEFFRNMVNDVGDSYRCMIDTIEIEDADSPEDALSTALRIFEERYHLSSWNHFAHSYEAHDVSRKEARRA